VHPTTDAAAEAITYCFCPGARWRSGRAGRHTPSTARTRPEGRHLWQAWQRQSARRPSITPTVCDPCP